MYTHICIHTNTYIHTHARKRAYPCMHAHMHTYIYTPTYTHVRMHVIHMHTQSIHIWHKTLMRCVCVCKGQRAGDSCVSAGARGQMRAAAKDKLFCG